MEVKLNHLGKHGASQHSLVPTHSPKSEALTVGSEIQLSKSAARGKKTSQGSAQSIATKFTTKRPIYHRPLNAVTVSSMPTVLRHTNQQSQALKLYPSSQALKLYPSTVMPWNFIESTVKPWNFYQKQSSPETLSQHSQSPQWLCCERWLTFWLGQQQNQQKHAAVMTTKTKQETTSGRFILWHRCTFWPGSVPLPALARSESPKWGLCHHENCWRSGIHQTAAGKPSQSAPARVKTNIIPGGWIFLRIKTKYTCAWINIKLCLVVVYLNKNNGPWNT